MQHVAASIKRLRDELKNILHLMGGAALNWILESFCFPVMELALKLSAKRAECWKLSEINLDAVSGLKSA